MKSVMTDELRAALVNPQYINRSRPDILTVYDEIPGAAGRPVCRGDELLFRANPEWDDDTIWSVFEYGEGRFSEGRQAGQESVKDVLRELVK